MNKYKLSGLILAVILLAAALLFKFFGGDDFEPIAFILLSIGVWAIGVVETIAYKKCPEPGFGKNLELARLIGGYIFSVIVTAGVVIYFLFGSGNG